MIVDCLFHVLLLFITNILFCLSCHGPSDVTIGSDTYACLILGPLDWSSEGVYIQIPSRVTADELSSIEVPGSWSSPNYEFDNLMKKLSLTNMSDPGVGLGLSIKSSGVLSYQRAYRQIVGSGDSARGITFPLQMVIINVDVGEVKSVVWDDTCNWCSHSSCAQNTYDYEPTAVITKEGKNCFVDDTQCLYEDINNTTNKELTVTRDLCTINVYIVWTGTDKDGNNLMSGAERFSLIKKWQMENGYIDPLENTLVGNIVSTPSPTMIPTERPTEMPTEVPSILPTPLPGSPTLSPSTAKPTDLPTEVPTKVPSVIPTAIPTAILTETPTKTPTEQPTTLPTEQPTPQPSV